MIHPGPCGPNSTPDLWWRATASSIRQVLSESGVDPADVEGMGLMGQMYGLVLLDRDGEVLRPAILWNDQRTGAECDEIRERLGNETAPTVMVGAVLLTSAQSGLY